MRNELKLDFYDESVTDNCCKWCEKELRNSNELFHIEKDVKYERELLKSPFHFIAHSDPCTQLTLQYFLEHAQ